MNGICRFHIFVFEIPIYVSGITDDVLIIIMVFETNTIVPTQADKNAR